MTNQPTPSTTQLSTQALRTYARRKRQALSAEEQNLASKKIFEKLKIHPDFLQAKHIAFYAAIDGELNLELLINEAIDLKKQCYLPSVTKESQQLSFYSFDNTKALEQGIFNIQEVKAERTPQSENGNAFDIKTFDLVVMPLVAFDKKGNRLGMGGGYYDFSFRHLLESKGFGNKSAKNKNNETPSIKTRLIGVAHSCQEVELIRSQEWDIKPHEIISV